MTIILIFAFFALLPHAPVVCFLDMPYQADDGKEYEGIFCCTTLFHGLKMKRQCPAIRIVPSIFA